MSVESSEIITGMLHSLSRDLITLHNQHINDMQALIARVEIRMIEALDHMDKRLTKLEQANERSAQP
jgi:hypothetical protein